MTGLRKLKRTEVLAFKKQLHARQGGTCPLCLKSLGTDFAKIALDHDHITGECRGVLHLGCNKTEGSVLNSIATWGGVGKDYDAVIPYLQRLIVYLQAPGTGVTYHLHKTEDEKREQRNRKARDARAKRKAAELIKKRG